MSKIEASKPAAAPAQKPIDELFAEIPLQDNAPVAICRVLVEGPYGGIPEKPSGYNLKGDRISLDPREAAWHAKNSRVAIEVSQVLPSELRAAGGIDSFLAANPKKDKLTTQQRLKLPKTLGIPTDEERQYPWEFEHVED